MIDERLLNDY